MPRYGTEYSIRRILVVGAWQQKEVGDMIKKMKLWDRCFSKLSKMTLLWMIANA